MAIIGAGGSEQTMYQESQARTARLVQEVDLRSSRPRKSATPSVSSSSPTPERSSSGASEDSRTKPLPSPSASNVSAPLAPEPEIPANIPQSPSLTRDPVQRYLQDWLQARKNIKPEATAAEDEVTRLLETTMLSTSTTPFKASASPQRQDTMRNLALLYYRRNQELIEQNFNVGGIIQRQRFDGLEVTLEIQLDGTGDLQSVLIAHSSGDAHFDQQAVHAVRRVKKFILPEDSQVVDAYFRTIMINYKI